MDLQIVAYLIKHPDVCDEILLGSDENVLLQEIVRAFSLVRTGNSSIALELASQD